MDFHLGMLSAGIELVFLAIFLEAGTVLRFGFSVRRILSILMF